MVARGHPVQVSSKKLDIQLDWIHSRSQIAPDFRLEREFEKAKVKRDEILPEVNYRFENILFLKIVTRFGVLLTLCPANMNF